MTIRQICTLPFLQQLPILPLPLFSYYPVCLLHNALHGVEYVLIAGTAAEMPGYQLFQLLPVVPLSCAHNLHGRHDKTGGAESSLHGRLFYEGFLDGTQFTVGTL